VRTETLPTLQRHQFRLLNTHAPLRVELQDDEGALANKAVELYVDGVLDETVTETDGNGMFETLVHVRATKVFLVVDDKDTYVLSVGALDPAQAARGAQQRLRNLGFDVGDPDDTAGPQTWAAAKRFQAETGLDETGELDQTTIDALLDAHGS
jgi:N-acetylmuramoyl-L-alanine amidase